MRRSTRKKSCHIAHRVDKQGGRPSVSDQAGVEKLATGSKSPVNNWQEAAHNRPSPNNCLSVINTNNVTKTKKKKNKSGLGMNIVKSYNHITLQRFFPSK